MTVSEQLAAFAARTTRAVLPHAVVECLKLHLLDTLGVALAGVRLDFGSAAIAAGRELSSGGVANLSTVWGTNDQLPAPWAAFTNGTLAHGLDYDNTHQESVVHVSAGIVPAVLAAAEAGNSDGRALITALAIGEEAAIRIGLAARGGFHDRGYHPTGVCNAFGAALAAGALANLSPDALANALGIAGSQASGLMEFLTDGTWVKRIHGGWAAHAGLVAAVLARYGFTGPRAVLDGRFGFYRTHLGEGGWDLTAVTDGLGERWHLLDTALKPYPCCHYNHAFIDAAAALRAAHALTPDAIERIECHIHARQVPVVCEPIASKRAPQTDYDAKFSLPYAVTSLFVRGHVDVDDFTPEAIREPAVLALAERTYYVEDPTSDFPRRFGGRLRVHLRNGGVLDHHEPINRGSAERPLTHAEVEAKFRHNAARSLPAVQVDRVIEAVAMLDQVPTAGRLVAALRSS